MSIALKVLGVLRSNWPVSIRRTQEICQANGVSASFAQIQLLRSVFHAEMEAACSADFGAYNALHPDVRWQRKYTALECCQFEARWCEVSFNNVAARADELVTQVVEEERKFSDAVARGQVESERQRGKRERKRQEQRERRLAQIEQERLEALESPVLREEVQAWIAEPGHMKMIDLERVLLLVERTQRQS